MASQNCSVAEFRKVLALLAGNATEYRKKAFEKAIDSLDRYGSPSITLAQAKTLAGFGEGICNRLKEYIQKGALVELKGVEEKNKTVDLFKGIFGVGDVTANRWYEIGYRELKDIPLVTLTDNQKIGLQYYHDLNSRIPREEIDQLKGELATFFEEFNLEYKCNLKWQICGSYLRGKPTSGDIDIVITETNGKFEQIRANLLSLIVETGYISHILTQGGSKILCVGGLDKKRRIDFEIASPEEWVFAVLYFTGSKEFNVKMRQCALDKNLTLNEKGLHSDKFCFGFEKEEEIFEFLGMEWVDPVNR